LTSATDINIHFLLLKSVLALNPKKLSSIVECGVFKGATSVVLSIGAKITGENLYYMTLLKVYLTVKKIYHEGIIPILASLALIKKACMREH
jgi:hypothetical protein